MRFLKWINLLAMGGLVSFCFGHPRPPGDQFRVSGGLPSNEISAASAPYYSIVAAIQQWTSTTPERMSLHAMDTDDLFFSMSVQDIPLPPGVQGDIVGDPMAVLHLDTGTKIVGGTVFDLQRGAIFVAKKWYGDTGFQPSVAIPGSLGADKAMMAIGPWIFDPSVGLLLVASNLGCFRSYDYGDTWSSAVSLGEPGFGYFPKISPEGIIYILFLDLDSKIKLARSMDGGETYEIKLVSTPLAAWPTASHANVPGTARTPRLPTFDISPIDGSLHCIYTDITGITPGLGNNMDVCYTMSADMGETWTVPIAIPVDDDTNIGDQFFPSIALDALGRIHVTCASTHFTPQEDDAPTALVHNYYTYSQDYGANWSPPGRLTPDPWNSANYGLQRVNQFLGDYGSLVVVGGGAYGDFFMFPFYVSTQSGAPDIFSNLVDDYSDISYP